ncbi:ACT domain-containing protein [uncultured Psychrosphaera sp.]|jgi:glycine cleavage system transcriptional repressor|uniref:glycine cleavage system protein R n=1 Tax=uncultured Psychrosphaera sp. TaxID=1403522 RepID=UPI0026212D6B|nr:ACT domain-containing protein [uncultured Psychrosphaera sp.]
MSSSFSTTPTKHLVLTVIGKDRTGLVSQLTGLITQCKCNILDSKMAIFGSEFTMIMLLAGDNASLAQLEVQLPPLAMSLNLLTMMKRTTTHKGLERTQYQVIFDGPDSSGTIRLLTSFFAEHKVSVSSLKSKATNKDGKEWQVAEIRIGLTDEIQLDVITSGCEALCRNLGMTCTFSPITIEQ